MKFVMERTRLLEALALAGRVAPVRNTIPILGHVLLVTQRGNVAFTATDMDRTLTVDVAAESIARKGSTTVNAQSFHAFVRATPDGCQVEAELDDRKGERLVLRAGRARATLPALPPADFPVTAAETYTAQFDVRGEELARAIKRVAHAQSNEETRYYLNGIFLHRRAEGLRLVATDGHRLAWSAVTPEKAAPEEMPGVIVPRDAVRDLLALAETGEILSIEVSANRLQASIAPADGAGVVLSTRLVDGTYPDYDRVIPASSDAGLHASRTDFLAAVQRCAALQAGVKEDRSTKLVLGKTTASLSRRRGDTGDIEDEIDVTTRGKPAETGFNYAYMIDALGALDSASLDLEFTPGAPLLLRDPADRDGQLQIVMAMRV